MSNSYCSLHEWQAVYNEKWEFTEERLLDAKEKARWLTMDRFSAKYYPHSPYSYAIGNPVRYIYINGDSIWIAHKGDNYLYENGTLYLNGQEYTGKVRGFLKQTVNALNHVVASGSYGEALAGILQQSEHNYTIVKSSKNEFTPLNSVGAMANTQEFRDYTGSFKGSSGSGGTIKWNPNSIESGLNTAGNTYRPAFIGLSHEMQHASDANFGILHSTEGVTNPITGKTYNPTHEGLNKREWRSVYLENQIRSHHNLPLRTHYGIINGQPSGPRLLNTNEIPRLP